DEGILRPGHDHRQHVSAEVVRAHPVGGGGGGQLGGDVDRLHVIGRPDKREQGGRQHDGGQACADDQRQGPAHAGLGGGGDGGGVGHARRPLRRGSANR